MSKTTVTRLFIAANVAIVVGVILVLATVVTALAGGVVTIGGPSVVAIDGHTFTGAVGWLLLAAVILGGGTLIGIASWVGALFNTSALEDKTWFGALLALGLLSFGWVAMVAYVVAGPDGTSSQRSDNFAVTA